MTRFSSLFVASTLAILPLSAFAQQTAAPAKTTAPTSMATTAPTGDKTVTGAASMDKTSTDKNGTTKAPADATANVTQPAAKPDVKSDAKSTGHGVKNDVHGMNGVNAHHAKASVPAKAIEPAKS